MKNKVSSHTIATKLTLLFFFIATLSSFLILFFLMLLLHPSVSKSIFNDVVFAVLLTVALMTVFSQIFVKFFSSPIEHLRRVTDAFAKGDYASRAHIESDDEIGRLAESFNKMATQVGKLDTLKSEFLSTVAHQLKNPIGGSRWALELLAQKSKNDPQIKHLVELLRANNVQVNDLITDLINMARIDSGVIKTNAEPVKADQVLKILVKDKRVIAKQHNVRISLDAPERVCSIFIDPQHFRHILSNILDNAIKFSKQNGKVKVKLYREEKNIIIKISDHGIGIPESDQPGMFGKFFRGSNATKKDVTGTGLGLYVVRSYARYWNGDIAFESKENEGTTFTLTLPCNQHSYGKRKKAPAHS